MLILTALGRLLRPADCLACGAADAWPCCAACLPPEPAGAGPWRLATDPTVTLWALGLYGDVLRAAVLAGKLRGQAAALRALGSRLGALLLAAGVGADLVTWIAARPARGLPRDHAEQVAAGVAAALDLPLASLLAPTAGRDLGRSRRDGHAGHDQRGQPDHQDPQDRWDRWDHYPDHRDRSDQAPARPPPRVRQRLAGGRVLLVDDVATTGRTLAGAVTALRQAGAHEVEVAVLAAASAAFGPPGTGRSTASRRSASIENNG